MVINMEVITVRVHDKIRKSIDFLTKEKNKTKADLIRELMGKAVEEEELNIYLKKYQNKELTLRMFAKKLDLPLWRAWEIISQVEFPYSKSDLQRDLRIINENT